jgi:hypothetical protein
MEDFEALSASGGAAQVVRVRFQTNIFTNYGSACGPVIVPVFKFVLSHCFQMVTEWQAGCVDR